MRDTLQFIYTGDVQILARYLVVSVDYLFLPELKSACRGSFRRDVEYLKLYFNLLFSQRYQFEELLAKTEKYILANFTAVYETNREEVLNMSSKEMEM